MYMFIAQKKYFDCISINYQVTLFVGAKGGLELPTIYDKYDLKNVLQRLRIIGSSNHMTVRLKFSSKSLFFFIHSNHKTRELETQIYGELVSQIYVFIFSFLPLTGSRGVMDSSVIFLFDRN